STLRSQTSGIIGGVPLARKSKASQNSCTIWDHRFNFHPKLSGTVGSDLFHKTVLRNIVCLLKKTSRCQPVTGGHDGPTSTAPTHRGDFLSYCRVCHTTKTCGRAQGISTTLSSAATG